MARIAIIVRRAVHREGLEKISKKDEADRSDGEYSDALTSMPGPDTILQKKVNQVSA